MVTTTPTWTDLVNQGDELHENAAFIATVRRSTQGKHKSALARLWAYGKRHSYLMLSFLGLISVLCSLVGRWIFYPDYFIWTGRRGSPRLYVVYDSLRMFILSNGNDLTDFDAQLLNHSAPEYTGPNIAQQHTAIAYWLIVVSVYLAAAVSALAASAAVTNFMYRKYVDLSIASISN